MGFGQEQRLCLLPAAVQFNAPAKILGSDPVLGNWDPDGFSMGVDPTGVAKPSPVHILSSFRLVILQGSVAAH